MTNKFSDSGKLPFVGMRNAPEKRSVGARVDAVLRIAIPVGFAILALLAWWAWKGK